MKLALFKMGGHKQQDGSIALGYTTYNPKTKRTRDEPIYRIEGFVAWYDLWIGLFIDRKKRIAYLCPFPMIGIKIRY